MCLRVSGFESTNAFPGTNGEIVVTGYQGKAYFEIEIMRDDGTRYIYEVKDEEVFDFTIS